MLSRDKIARLAPPLLILGGLGAIGVAFAADLLGAGSESGFGMNQLRAVMLGIAMIAAGVFAGWANKRGGVWSVIREFWTTAPRADSLQYLVLGLWFGLMCGIVEVIHIWTRRFGFDIASKQPDEIFWMVPLSYLLMAVPCAIVLAIVTRLVPGRLPIAVGLFPLVYEFARSQLRVYPWYGLTITVLAIAIGIVVGKSCYLNGKNWLRTAKLTLVPLMVLIAVGAFAFPMVRGMKESSAIAALPGAAQGAPNVLFVVLDTVRADHLGSYGHSRATTPRIDAVAERGVLFEHPIAISSWTLPSHSSMFTGRYGYEMNANWTAPLNEEHPTLAERFAGAGYHTGGFVGNLRFCASEWGIDRGFAHYEDFMVNPAVIGFSSILGKMYMGRYYGKPFHEHVRNNADLISDRFLSWLDDVGTDRPFFGFLNYFDAHALYLTHPDYQGKFGEVSPHIRDWHDPKKKWDDEQMEGFRIAYDGCLAFLDNEFGRLLDELQSRGALENTIVVVVGDHGELFGEHGLQDHGNALYRNLVEVPLIISYPGQVPQGQRITRPVSLRDLPKTVLDLAQVESGEAFPGHSLAALWNGDPDAATLSPLITEISKGINTPPTLPISKGDLRSIFVDGYQYIQGIRLFDDRKGKAGSLFSEELFDTSEDPMKEQDLSDSPEHADRMKRMRELLESHR